MILDAFEDRGVIANVDPRARVLCGAAAALAPVFLSSYHSLAAALGVAFLGVLCARVPGRSIVRRLAVVNLFMGTLFLFLPWGVPGTALVQMGALQYSVEGLEQAALITLRGNAILLMISAFVGTMEPVVFAHALERLYIPHRFVVLYLFTVRYLGVFEREYRRLRKAMAVRAFRPRLDTHTLRNVGYLVGMLLVRALDRSERILDAMQCRGYAGRIPVHWHFRYRPIDGGFAMIVAVALASLFAVEFV